MVDTQFAAIYEKLRALAGRYFQGRQPGQTLQPTALVNEAYLKMAAGSLAPRDSGHFFAIAATAMRQVLVDHARRRRRDKRGGHWQRVTLKDPASPERCVDLLVLDDLLAKLAEVNAFQAQVVELRFFAGLTNEEVAKTLDASVRSVERHWRFARAWLKLQLEPPNDEV